MAFRRAMATAQAGFPVSAPVAVPPKPTFLDHAKTFVGVTQSLMILAGGLTIGITLWLARRTPAQVLHNQPARVRDPKKGVLAGVSVLAVGFTLMAIGWLISVATNRT